MFTVEDIGVLAMLVVVTFAICSNSFWKHLILREVGSQKRDSLPLLPQKKARI